MLVMSFSVRVSMLVMHLCVRGIDVGHISVCERYRCWSCICVSDIDVGHAFVCKGYRCCHVFVC